MDPVPEDEAVRHWLRQERAGRDPPARTALRWSDPLASLLEINPGPTAFLLDDRPTQWYRTAVSLRELGSYRLIETPDGVLWDALSPDGTVRGAARRVADGDPATLSRETGIDVEWILELEASLGDERAPAPVIRTRKGRTPRVVVDGNHRAVARVLSGLRGSAGPLEEPPSQPVYIGVRANPVLRPAIERLGGILDAWQP